MMPTAVRPGAGRWGRVLALAGLALAAAAMAGERSRYFVIEVVDDQTGRGVPLVELRTTNEVRYFTDSAGVAALDEPGLEGRETFLHVSSHGYQYPADGFGIRGARVVVKAGDSVRLRIHRTSIAERLYRVTGEGIYRDSVLAGRPVPIRQPLLNSQVTGQDSVQNAVYRGQLYWFWGDTGRPGYPLGNFHTTGATSRLAGDGGLDPDQGVDLTYFQARDGFTREMAPFSDKGPTWIDGLVALPEDGRERLFMTYANVNQKMEALERGLGRWDDDAGRFEKVAVFNLEAPVRPSGHPFRAVEAGQPFLYFGDAYPLVRVPAQASALRDLSRYQAFSCLRAGTRLDSSHPEAARLDRDAQGRLRYAWKRNTSPVGPGEQNSLVKAGKMRREEGLLQLREPDSGSPVLAHAGSVCWNSYRRKWLLITAQFGGSSSMLGETWYAEAPTPLGPWVYARKIVTHRQYSLYNPKQHPYFDQDGGRKIYFEGTYAATFSGTPETTTPRYDYNQVMYRLDLADPRLVLPAPIQPPWGSRQPGEPAQFCAADRAAPGLVPLYWNGEAGHARLATTAVTTGQLPVFYALPAELKPAPPTTEPLWEAIRASDGARRYGVGGASPPLGYKPGPRPLCRVWKNPCPVELSARSAAPTGRPSGE